jgi:hypothetical protein
MLTILAAGVALLLAGYFVVLLVLVIPHIREKWPTRERRAPLWFA